MSAIFALVSWKLNCYVANVTEPQINTSVVLTYKTNDEVPHVMKYMLLLQLWNYEHLQTKWRNEFFEFMKP